ncbi:MAG TPA: NAD(P)/FAD-dependent oxidoreductase [Thermoplasmatales archaeon]|nr:NAD(P)/FAD-dependent oxidoreductase [Thermoplasmatales archaeon]
MKDVVIIGAGISGLYLSHLLDKAGIDFVVLEKKEKIGNEGYRAVSEDFFRKVKPDDDIILEHINHIRLVSAYGYEIERDAKGYSFKLSDIENELMERISEVERVHCKSKVEDVNLSKGKIKSRNESINFRVLILACGAWKSSLRNSLGIENRDLSYVHACRIQNIEKEDAGIIIDNKKTEGLFAWMMPLREYGIEIGLFSLRDIADWRDRLFEIKYFHQFRKCRVLEEFHGITPMSPANISYGERWIAIGSAANGQPLVGAPALQCLQDAEIAYNLIVRYIEEGENELNRFNQIWKKNHRNLYFQSLIQSLLRSYNPRFIHLMLKVVGRFIPFKWV